MLILYESAAGFALFKVLDEGKLKDVDNIWQYFNDLESAQKVLKLKHFYKFANTTEALDSAMAIDESKVSSVLKGFLKEVKKEELGVIDTKLGKAINKKLGIQCVHNKVITELTRGIRTQFNQMLSDVPEKSLRAMDLGLSHSLSRYKLKFSADKVDTMIVQAVALIDDLDKEINTYSMRAREWYGWHFPEINRIVPDNELYAKVIKLMGNKSNAQEVDFSQILDTETAQDIIDAAKISMGTDISTEDLSNIIDLCNQILSIGEYRKQLGEYLSNRMNAIAPNLTSLVGELVGARLIAHAGSLLSLAKHPASTIQILGAEKALFRAIKTRHQTPKYGLIYHASIIGSAPTKFKGKISRVLAGKCALSIRVDALGDKDTPNIGTQDKEYVESRLRQLEGKETHIASSRSNNKDPKKYENTKDTKNPGLLRETTTFNEAQDINLSGKGKKRKQEEPEVKSDKKEKKEKKKSKKEKKSKVEAIVEPIVEEKKEKKQKKEKKEKKEKKSKKSKKSKK